jgi:hypothetical protein
MVTGGGGVHSLGGGIGDGGTFCAAAGTPIAAATTATASPIPTSRGEHTRLPRDFPHLLVVDSMPTQVVPMSAW